MRIAPSPLPLFRGGGGGGGVRRVRRGHAHGSVFGRERSSLLVSQHPGFDETEAQVCIVGDVAATTATVGHVVLLTVVFIVGGKGGHEEGEGRDGDPREEAWWTRAASNTTDRATERRDAGDVAVADDMLVPLGVDVQPLCHESLLLVAPGLRVLARARARARARLRV